MFSLIHNLPPRFFPFCKSKCKQHFVSWCLSHSHIMWCFPADQIEVFHFHCGQKRTNTKIPLFSGHVWGSDVCKGIIHFSDSFGSHRHAEFERNYHFATTCNLPVVVILLCSIIHSNCSVIERVTTMCIVFWGQTYYWHYVSETLRRTHQKKCIVLCQLF